MKLKMKMRMKMKILLLLNFDLDNTEKIGFPDKKKNELSRILSFHIKQKKNK